MITEPTVRVLSLGAGVQSTTLALLAVEGEVPRPDAAIFADTGYEPAAVYEHLDRLEVTLDSAGVPLHRVSNGNLRDAATDPQHRYASIPYFVRNPDGSHGMGRRQCTHEYKLAPISRKVRALLGAAPPDYRRVPKGRVAEQWVGFSTDELARVKHSRVAYQRLRFPLLELGMNRRDCQQWLAARGWTVAKSACIGCPFHGNRQWRDMRDNHPAEWADAVAFDRAIRHGGARGLPLHGEAFLHAQRVPLDQADLRSPAQRAEDAGQLGLWDTAEDGDPDGCSPFGCRSGYAV